MNNHVIIRSIRNKKHYTTQDRLEPQNKWQLCSDSDPGVQVHNSLSGNDEYSLSGLQTLKIVSVSRVNRQRVTVALKQFE